MSRRFRNLPYRPGFDEWDEEWDASLGIYGSRVNVAKQLEGIVVGEDREILAYPVIPLLRSGASRTVTKAWLTVKKKETDADGAAVFQLEITTADSPGVGQVINASSAELRFDVTDANSALLEAHRVYHFDVKMLLSDSRIYVVERGYFKAGSRITVDAS